MNKAILRAESLSKVYQDAGSYLQALDNINLSIAEGDYLAIVGPAGAGKSTLLHILGGLDRPTKGKVFFGQKDIASMKRQEIYRLRNEHLGFVFQFYYLISELNVWENITLPVLIGKRKLKEETKAWADELVGILGLKNRLKAFPFQLSGGQRQKVALARALINRPRVLFCDEPTGNLDKDSAGVVRETLQAMNERYSTTIILVTHNLELAQAASNIVYLKEGRIVN